jgi:putative sigma-54 modulation protein
MKLILSTHNITLTQAIEDHVLGQIEKLDHFDRWTIDARVTLEHDHTRTTGKQFSCSIRLAVRGPDLFAEDVESDLYAAIDKVAKKIKQQIRKRHGKRAARKHMIAVHKRTRRETGTA